MYDRHITTAMNINEISFYFTFEMCGWHKHQHSSVLKICTASTISKILPPTGLYL